MAWVEEPTTTHTQVECAALGLSPSIKSSNPQKQSLALQIEVNTEEGGESWQDLTEDSEWRMKLPKTQTTLPEIVTDSTG